MVYMILIYLNLVNTLVTLILILINNIDNSPPPSSSSLLTLFAEIKNYIICIIYILNLYFNGKRLFGRPNLTYVDLLKQNTGLYEIDVYELVIF